jgi:hypothetical protein
VANTTAPSSRTHSSPMVPHPGAQMICRAKLQVAQHMVIHTRHTGSTTVVMTVTGTTMRQAEEPKAPHGGITKSTGTGAAALGLMLRTMGRSQGKRSHHTAYGDVLLGQGLYVVNQPSPDHSPLILQ